MFIKTPHESKPSAYSSYSFKLLDFKKDKTMHRGSNIPCISALNDTILDKKMHSLQFDDLGLKISLPHTI